jgi:hypothetical protein
VWAARLPRRPCGGRRRRCPVEPASAAALAWRRRRPIGFGPWHASNISVIGFISVVGFRRVGRDVAYDHSIAAQEHALGDTENTRRFRISLDGGAAYFRLEDEPEREWAVVRRIATIGILRRPRSLGRHDPRRPGHGHVASEGSRSLLFTGRGVDRTSVGDALGVRPSDSVDQLVCSA